MRSEKEMIDLILDTARKDERIRAVYMNGSRTNPNAPKDLFQDYDIVYVVRETLPFIKDTTWIDRFGERLYMQLPEQTGLLLGYEADLANCYGWLMQFTDGNRIDLHVQSIPYLRRFLTQADWNAFLSTYASGALAEMWAATVSMCRLFDRTAREVAQKLHYPYDEQEAENSFQYLLHVQRLPKGVSAIDDLQKIEIKNSL